MSEGVDRPLLLRRLDQLEAVPLQGTEGTTPLAFSPDGGELLVVEGTEDLDGSVKRLSLTGGPATTIAVGHAGAAWGPDDTVVLGGTLPRGLRRIRASGGEATVLTTLAEEEFAHGVPVILPNGRGVLFTVYTADPATSRVAVYNFDTGQQDYLLLGTRPQYATTGHLVFWRNGALWAAPFDQDRLEVSGDPVVVLDSVAAQPATETAIYSLADNGTLVYLPGESAITDTMGWVNREGVMLTPLAEGMSTPRLSPGGKHIAFQKVDQELWILDLESRRETRLAEGGVGFNPVWPDDTTVTFQGDRGDGWQLYARRVDRSSETDLVLATEFIKGPGSWTPDGQTLVYYAVNTQGDRDIWMLPVGGDPVPFLVTASNERAPRLSPNGKWLAYISDQPGEDRIFVQAFPEGGERHPVSTGPGTEAVWSRDGRELFYRNGNEMWVVEVETGGPEFRLGNQRLLFEQPYTHAFNAQGSPNYDVSLDGQQFLMVQTGAAGTAELTLVLNWTEELTRLVPVD
jgi:hypothetical protein